MNEFINDKVLPPIMKFVNTRAVNALKNGMLYAMPFIIVGSIFLILANLPIPSVATWLTNNGWAAIFSQAYAMSFGILAIWAAVGIGYIYVKDAGYGDVALQAGLTSLSAFFIVQSLSIANPITAALATGNEASGIGTLTGTQATAAFEKLPDAMQVFLNNPVTGVINLSWQGGQGMIAAIVIGILSGWAYTAMMNAGWKIKLPEQVPANVANQFTAMIPTGVIIIVATVVYAMFKNIGNTDLVTFIYHWLSVPLQSLGDSFGGIIVIALLVPFFWFFGVHGGIIMGAIASAFLIPNTAANAALYQSHKLSLANGAHIVTNEFYNNFINLSGSGITFGLIIFTLFFAKSQQMKSIGKVEMVPGLFNINEPFLFGLPMVMNPVLAIPFFLTPVIVSATVYGAIYFGIVPPMNGVAAPWTTPPIISGFLIGGWQYAVLQIVALLESILLYLPFARKYDKMLLAQEAEEENN
ncbi:MULTISPECIES: PTS sugar transporter subunit IIC [unclassified Lactococcus]|uniref:PTS sugar transporter subunit IIC n=1 Tax=unclassified Lactococcus TaxID=2643510 RepID=UPI0011CB3D1D|nr:MULTISPECIES: PTS sugar transporter subunit IIC [unclassified Lactococcus]MQW22198.1 PTS sugar transporter subunit IIC [Lactococcus sp. dk101]TXK45131.1 PTS sugar transporter subunit IIC [Lactococcus sp. dk310]TXK51089.1 PTS sugar transporter subunit IIC [Lactococcus sp. dk322]